MSEEIKIEEESVGMQDKTISKLAMIAKTKVDEGQEKLLEIYDRKVVEGVTKVLVGADGGSTSSRVLFMYEDDTEPDTDDVYIIPSSHAETNSKDEIIAQSEQLYDKMDSIITDKSKEEGVFDKYRILRGTKFTSSSLVEEKLNSTRQKIDTPAFYLNLIDAIAYGIVMSKEVLTKRYEIYAGVSLPPNDANSKANREKFKKNMLRTFTWENKELGLELELEFKQASIQTEPESNVKAFHALQGEEAEEFSMCIEAGGSTIGSELMHNGKSNKSASQTFPYGGRQLQDKIVELYREQVGGGAMSAREKEEVLKTGAFTVGRETKDAVKQLVEAFDYYADKIYNDTISNCFDTQVEIPLNYIQTIYLSGRLFRDSNFKKILNPVNEFEKLAKYSLSIPLSKRFAKELPTVKFVRISKNYIPLGNLLNVMNEYGGYVLPDSDDEVAGTEIDQEPNEPHESSEITVASDEI